MLCKFILISPEQDSSWEEGGPVHTVPCLLARSWATIGLAGVILRNLVMSTYTRLGQPRYDIYNSGSRITIRRQ